MAGRSPFVRPHGPRKAQRYSLSRNVAMGFGRVRTVEQHAPRNVVTENLILQNGKSSSLQVRTLWASRTRVVSSGSWILLMSMATQPSGAFQSRAHDDRARWSPEGRYVGARASRNTWASCYRCGGRARALLQDLFEPCDHLGFQLCISGAFQPLMPEPPPSMVGLGAVDGEE